MKRIINAIFIGLLILSMVGCGSSSSESPNEQEPVETIKYQLYLDVDFEGNILRNTYDVNVLLDGDTVGTIEHGQYFTHLMEVAEGQHTIRFHKIGDTGIKGEESFQVDTDTTFKCSIHAKGKEIIIDGIEVIKSIESSSIEMEDLLGINLSKALDLLKEKGFVNVNYEAEDDSIWDTDNWTVISQNVDAGKAIDKNDQILLTCIKTENYINNNLAGISVPTAIDKAYELGYDKFTFKESELNSDITDVLNSLSENELNEIIVISASQSSSDEKRLEIVTDYEVKYEMPDVVDKTLEEALKTLKDAGFVNIQYAREGNEKAAKDDVVIKQSMASGTQVKSTEEIYLTCKRPDDLAEEKEEDAPKDDPSSQTEEPAEVGITQEDIRIKVENQPCSTVRSFLAELGFSVNYTHENTKMDFTGYIESYTDEELDASEWYVAGIEKTDIKNKTISLYVNTRENAEYHDEQDRIREELEKNFDVSVAISAAEQYGKNKYGSSFKIKGVTGLIAETAVDENTWFIKYKAEWNGDEYTCEATVEGPEDDPTVIKFDLY